MTISLLFSVVAVIVFGVGSAWLVHSSSQYRRERITYRADRY